MCILLNNQINSYGRRGKKPTPLRAALLPPNELLQPVGSGGAALHRPDNEFRPDNDKNNKKTLQGKARQHKKTRIYCDTKKPFAVLAPGFAQPRADADEAAFAAVFGDRLERQRRFGVGRVY